LLIKGDRVILTIFSCSMQVQRGRICTICRIVEMTSFSDINDVDASTSQNKSDLESHDTMLRELSRR
jgi:hypothetical protein